MCVADALPSYAERAVSLSLAGDNCILVTQIIPQQNIALHRFMCSMEHPPAIMEETFLTRPACMRPACMRAHMHLQNQLAVMLMSSQICLTQSAYFQQLMFCKSPYCYSVFVYGDLVIICAHQSHFQVNNPLKFPCRFLITHMDTLASSIYFQVLNVH